MTKETLDEMVFRRTGKTMQQNALEAKLQLQRHDAIRASWSSEWVVGDVIALKNPLDGKVDNQASVVEFVLAVKHKDNPKLFYGIVVDAVCTDLKSVHEVDIPANSGQCIPTPLRAYCNIGFWFHEDDLEISSRVAKVSEDIVAAIQQRFNDMIFGKLPEDINLEDPDYEELIGPLQVAAAAIEASIHGSDVLGFVYFVCVNRPEYIYKGTVADLKRYADDGYGPQLVTKDVAAWAASASHGHEFVNNGFVQELCVL